MSELVQLFFLAVIGSIIALVGGIAFLFNKKWSEALEENSIPFAAGVLITVTLIGLLPEAIELIGERAFPIVLATFFTVYLFEQLVFGIHHHREHQHGKNYTYAVPLVIVGDTIHNFIDGLAIGASFFVTPGLGLVTAISTFLHEIPHEIGDFGILLKAGWRKRDILVVNVVSAAATIVGAFALLLFSENSILIGSLLAVSGGIFLYLGASDFLPQTRETNGKKFGAILPLALGVASMYLTFMVVPHG